MSRFWTTYVLVDFMVFDKDQRILGKNFDQRNSVARKMYIFRWCRVGTQYGRACVPRRARVSRSSLQSIDDHARASTKYFILLFYPSSIFSIDSVYCHHLFHPFAVAGPVVEVTGVAKRASGSCCP